MLVVSRKREEGLLIGPDIYVTVLEISGGRVRLGFDAPKSVRICRRELDEQQPVEHLPEMCGEAGS